MTLSEAVMALTMSQDGASDGDIVDALAASRLLDELGPTWPKAETLRAAADSPIRAAAHAAVPSLDAAFRLAFARGRKAMTGPDSEDAAIAAMDKTLKRILPDMLLRIVTTGGEAAWLQLPKESSDVRSAAGFELRKTAAAWARQHAAELIDDVSETSRKRIQTAISVLLKGSATWDEAVDRIAAAVGDDDRALRIAQHEGMLAVAEGQRDAWGQAVEEGILSETAVRMWHTTSSEVCPVCLELEGQTAPLDSLYPGGLVGPPAHVGCWCEESLVGEDV